ncbi:hypothetical protein K9M59_02335 [Candidatus Gracilibacteria bacterium]|nr:hypothetical protein [Candidatus Gracilibacteria bacterium]MCF7819680.1 hypothetical protein [Candidatus Gracilibacteria bacterium]
MKKHIWSLSVFLICFFVFIFLLFPQKVEAANGWTALIDAGPRSWYAIASSSDGTKLAAGGISSYIYTSADSGATWTAQTNSGLQNWYRIASSFDGTKLVAVTWGGYIYTSADGGVTWTERTDPGSRNWLAVASSSDGTKIVAGAYRDGYIYTSSDGGETWTEQTSPGYRRQWYGITSSSDGTKLAAAARNGYIYTSTDSGVTWTAQTGSGSRSWYSIAGSADGMNLVAGVYEGYIYTSSDGGVTWTERTDMGTGRWYSVTSSADGTKLAAASTNGSYIYTSADSGETWTAQTGSGSRNWYALASSSDGTKIMAGVYGDYIYTYGPVQAPVSFETATFADTTTATLNGYVNTDHTVRGFQYGLTDSYGTTITQTGSFGFGSFSAEITSLIPNTTYHYRTFATNSEGTTYSADRTFKILPFVESANMEVEWWGDLTSSSDATKVAGIDGGGSIYTSADSGTTWTERTSSGARNWDGIASSDDGMKLVANVVNGYIYTSADGGETWTERTSAGERRWFDIASSSDGTKLVAANYGTYPNPGYLYTSTDGGATWTERTSSGTHYWYTIASSADGMIIVAAETDFGNVAPDRVHISTDGGATWTVQEELGRHWWGSVTVSPDGNTIIAAARDNGGGYIYTSHDGGATWKIRSKAGARKWLRTAVSSDGMNIVAAAIDLGNYLYTSTDGGETWTAQMSAGADGWWSVTASDDGKKIIASHVNGTIYTYLSPLTDIALSSQSVPSNSPAGTTVGMLSALYADTGDTLTFSLSSGENCDSTDNTRFTLQGTTLKINETTDFYTRNSYDICIEVENQDGQTYKEEINILVPAPANIEAATSSVGVSSLPDVPQIVLDGDKVVDLSAGSSSAEETETESRVNIDNTDVDLKSYSAGELSGVDVKNTAGISVKKATKISTNQANLVIRNADEPTTKLEISNDTVVFAESKSTFQIEPPKRIEERDIPSGSVPGGYTMKKAISVGSRTDSYVFDKTVNLVFEDLYEKVLMRKNGTAGWKEIPRCVGSYGTLEKPTFPSSCWISDEGIKKTKVVTYHLTDFMGLQESAGSGKTMFFRPGMKREDVGQSSYGTDKRTFDAAYERSLAQAEAENEGREGTTEYMVTSWGNEKFLKYQPGRMSVEAQKNTEQDRVAYTGSSKKEDDIGLVMSYRDGGMHTTAQRSLEERRKAVEGVVKGVRRTPTPARTRYGHRRRESSAEQVLRMRMQKEAIAEKKTQGVARRPSLVRERTESRIDRTKDLSNVKRSEFMGRRRGVLEYLQSSLIEFASLLKTSLLEIGGFLKTSLFDVVDFLKTSFFF